MIFQVTAPDGRKVRIEGAQAPSEAELDEIFASMPASDAPKVQKDESLLNKVAGAGKAALNFLTESEQKLGKALGESFAAGANADQLEEQNRQQMAQDNVIYQKMREAKAAGNTQEAQRLQSLLGNTSGLRTADQVVQELQQGREDAIKGAVGTAADLAFMGNSPLKANTTLGKVAERAGKEFISGAAQSYARTDGGLASKEALQDTLVGGLTSAALSGTLELASQGLQKALAKSGAGKTPFEKMADIKEQAANKNFSLTDQLLYGDQDVLKNRSTRKINQTYTGKMIEALGVKGRTEATKVRQTGEIANTLYKSYADNLVGKNIDLSQIADSQRFFGDIIEPLQDLADSGQLSTKNKKALDNLTKMMNGKQSVSLTELNDLQKTINSVTSSLDMSNALDKQIYPQLMQSKSNILDVLEQFSPQIKLSGDSLSKIAQSSPKLARDLSKNGATITQINTIYQVAKAAETLASNAKSNAWLTKMALPAITGALGFASSGPLGGGAAAAVGSAVGSNPAVGNAVRQATTGLGTVAKRTTGKAAFNLTKALTSPIVQSSARQINSRAAAAAQENSRKQKNKIPKGKYPVWDALRKPMSGTTSTVPLPSATSQP